jgi:hypothetical protein
VRRPQDATKEQRRRVTTGVIAAPDFINGKET